MFLFLWGLTVFLVHLFPIIYFQPFVSLYLKCISYRQHITKSIFIPSTNLCLLFGVDSPFAFTISIDTVEFRSTILFFVCPLGFLFIFSLLSCFLLDYEIFLKFYFNSLIVQLYFFSLFFSDFSRDYVIYP